MSLHAVKSSPSLRNSVSAEEWQARVDLAMVYRVLAHFGFNDLTYMHVSLRLPDQPHRLLLKPRNMMFEEVTASSLEKFDFDGTPLQDGPRNVGGGLVIHAGILEARPEINAVFHTHTPANMGVSAQQHGLLMCNQHAVGFYQRMAYHSFGGFEFNMDQRAPLLASLGDKTIALLRNHGALVCGTSLKKALIDHHYLEMACRGQIAALAGGSAVHLIEDSVCEYAAQQYARLDPDKDWYACVRLAERLDPGYKD